MLKTNVPAPAGASWVPGVVRRATVKGDKDSLVAIETLHLVFNDVQGYVAHFGDGVLNISDGTSFRVWQDVIWRNGVKFTVDAICQKIVAYRPGSRTRTAIQTFVGADDKFYATQAEAKAASLAWAFDQTQKDEQALSGEQ